MLSTSPEPPGDVYKFRVRKPMTLCGCTAQGENMHVETLNAQPQTCSGTEKTPDHGGGRLLRDSSCMVEPVAGFSSELPSVHYRDRMNTHFTPWELSVYVPFVPLHMTCTSTIRTDQLWTCANCLAQVKQASCAFVCLLLLIRRCPTCSTLGLLLLL